MRQLDGRPLFSSSAFLRGKKRRTERPLFSIIIPTLNEEHFLPLLLNDLKKQTFSNFEVLVVDAHSVDKTLSLARNFAFVRPFVSPQANVGYQRNFGAKKASGQILLFTDADTRLKPSFLANLTKHLRAQPCPDFFVCLLDYTDSRPSEKIIINLLNFILEASYALELPAAFGSFVGCRRRVFLALGGFDPKITFGEDSELVRRACRGGYNFCIYKEPRFYFSLRRFHKEGTFKLLRQYAKLNLKVLIEGFPREQNKNYLMLGGAYYQNQKPSSKFIAALDKFMKKFRKLNRKKTA